MTVVNPILSSSEVLFDTRGHVDDVATATTWWCYRNARAIGALKVIAESGWFAARPSGKEDIYTSYAESFRGIDHLHRILTEPRAIVDAVLAAPQRSADES